MSRGAPWGVRLVVIGGGAGLAVGTFVLVRSRRGRLVLVGILGGTWVGMLALAGLAFVNEPSRTVEPLLLCCVAGEARGTQLQVSCTGPDDRTRTFELRLEHQVPPRAGTAFTLPARRGRLFGWAYDTAHLQAKRPACGK